MSVEVPALEGRPADAGLIFYDRAKLSQDDLRLIETFLTSIQPGSHVDAATMSFIAENVEIDVFQICRAKSTAFGSVRIWAGKVLQQTVHVGAECPE